MAFPETTSQPPVSIIVVNYNGLRFVRNCLESVLATDYPNFEVLFVDNGSTDGSVEQVNRLFGSDKRLKVLQNSRNLGFSEGNNIGFRSARGKYVVFLNQDTVVHPTWLKEIVYVMESDRSIGAAQCKLYTEDRIHLDSSGDVVDESGLALCIGFGELDAGQYDCIRQIFSARGAAMIVRSEVFKEVGLFDRDFFAILEDVDLCWRIRLRGYGVVFAPKSVVYHVGIKPPNREARSLVYHVSGASTRIGFDKLASFHSRKNQLCMIAKNYELRNLLKYFPMAILFTLAIVLIEKTGRPARIKALLWVILNLGAIWKKRMRIQHSIRRVPDEYVTRYMLKGNIIFRYFPSWFMSHRNDYDFDQIVNQVLRQTVKEMNVKEFNLPCGGPTNTKSEPS